MNFYTGEGLFSSYSVNIGLIINNRQFNSADTLYIYHRNYKEIFLQNK